MKAKQEVKIEAASSVNQQSDLPAGVSLQRTSLRRSGGETSECSAEPDLPSRASLMLSAD